MTEEFEGGAPESAIGSIPGARAVHVPRSRFAPVKTTDDLLLVRSDAYELTSDGQIRPRFGGQEPVTLENRVRVVTCGSSGYQAARAYSLIRPPRTGFRRIRLRPRSATVR